jgi:predicted ATP-grasp superfamily ATP-dependent carboligase
MSHELLLIIGASTRAAAFSALRAELRPWCIDLFADRDLARRCPVQPLAGRYPHAFLEQSEAAPPGPWIYTGALEGWPALVARLARRRPLRGCDETALRRARDPAFVRDLLTAAGLPCPALAASGAEPPPDRRWLIKPRHGAAGSGIHFWDGQASAHSRRRGPTYVQEYLDGESVAVVYVADGRQARLLGATRQWTGLSWLHAAAFHYCGSVGPLPLEPSLAGQLQRLGQTLAAGCGLRGLFGVDGILRADGFWPVEINPRYTASMEVLEYASGQSVLRGHQAACQGTRGVDTPRSAFPPHYVGKAILFARDSLIFPDDGPWEADLQRDRLDEMPEHADISAAGQPIAAGRPVLTLLTRGSSLEMCEELLRKRAANLDRLLYQ